MRYLLATLSLSAVCLIANAQQAPPTLTVRAVGDRTNVFSQAGSDIEVFPTQRATPVPIAVGTLQVNAVHQEAAAAPFSSSSRGIIFNYATQQYGTTTGEIAFMMKPHSSVTDVHFGTAISPKKIMASGVYVVNATTPQSFLATLKQLQRNSAIAWVEPTIQYGRVPIPPPLR
jgi:hypothetical protein